METCLYRTSFTVFLKCPPKGECCERKGVITWSLGAVSFLFNNLHGLFCTLSVSCHRYLLHFISYEYNKLIHSLFLKCGGYETAGAVQLPCFVVVAGTVFVPFPRDLKEDKPFLRCLLAFCHSKFLPACVSNI